MFQLSNMAADELHPCKNQSSLSCEKCKPRLTGCMQAVVTIQHNIYTLLTHDKYFVKDGDDDLVSSLDSVISASRKHTCLQCGKSFSNAQSIRLHEPIHSGIYPYRCNICGRGIVSTSNYRRHMAMHTGTRDYKCPVCLLAFTCAWSLKRHIRQVHCHTNNLE